MVDDLATMLDELAELLPAQGPISIFIHHNTLHAFEDRPFEDAVEEAASRFGCEPYLPESRFRAKLAAGRIQPEDVESVIRETLGAAGSEPIGVTGSRFDSWRRLVLHGIPGVSGRGLAWTIEETGAAARFRTDLPRGVQLAAASAGENESDPAAERDAVRHLWAACLSAAGRARPAPRPAAPHPIRHRDLLRDAFGIDIDAWIDPTLIRFVAGYLDQGLASWPMPGRDAGMHACFIGLYGTPLAARCGPWAADLAHLTIADS